jgi:DNA-binding CsgD family transcriptional regulator
VAFGPDAEAVTQRILGERLARAVGQGLVSARDLAPPGSGAGTRLSARDRAAPARAATIPSTTVVTVDRLVDTRALPANGAPPATLHANHGPGVIGQPISLQRLHHRTIIRYSTRRLAGYGTRHDDRLPRLDGETLGTVLVVDTDPTAGDTPGLAARAAASLLERLEFKAGVISLNTDDRLITEIDGVPLDLVVLIVGAEPTGRLSSWSSSTWWIPSRLAGAYRSAGIEVLAVSAGASAGALSTCIEQGASVLFDLNTLPAQLLALPSLGATDRVWTPDRLEADLPEPLGALLTLTSSERRVLYYLTTGCSAQDIALDLIVSLTTVRSHIRSILRKLGVRSQLAAVALANSRAIFLDEASHAS